MHRSEVFINTARSRISSYGSPFFPSFSFLVYLSIKNHMVRFKAVHSDHIHGVRFDPELTDGRGTLYIDAGRV